jgi:uncharacterized protein (TIGR02453 family)
MAFRGWPVEAVEFYEGLAADNTKTYWLAHKHVYDDCVRAPMTALLDELEATMGGAKVYRPFRDVRFSKDKTPYKTQIAASFERGGYVTFSADGLRAGGGQYLFDKGQLARYREAVADDRTGGELTRLIATLESADIAVQSHEVLKRVPPGLPKDHPRADLLRYKDLVAWKHWPVGGWLGTTEPKKRLLEFWEHCGPLNRWLAAHVG